MPRIAATIGVLALIVFSIGFNISKYPIVWETSDASSHLLPSVESSQAKTATDSAKIPPVEEPTLQYVAQPSIDEQSRYAETVPYEPVPYGSTSYEPEPYEPVPYESEPYEPSPYATYTPPEEPSYRSPEPSEEPAPSEAPESSEVTAEPHTPGTSHDLAVPSPQLVETSAKYGAEVAPSEKVTTGVPARPMVPVITTKATPTADDVEESPELLLSGPLQPEPSSGPSSGSTESVRRLPPVAKVNPVPADHQAVQLPMTPIPIYPTTGF